MHQFTQLKHRYFVGHSHGFDLIVGHIDNKDYAFCSDAISILYVKGLPYHNILSKNGIF